MDFIEIPETKAKVTSKEARTLLDMFLTAASEEYHLNNSTAESNEATLALQ